MLTIFTIPKSFDDPHTKIIQENAIKSWKTIHPTIEIILISPDSKLKSIAKRLKVHAIISVKKNYRNTPYINSAFSLAKRHASYPLLLYTNADIIFSPIAIHNLVKRFSGKSKFLLAGGRTDLDIVKPIIFSDSSWYQKLKQIVKERGIIHPPLGSDYFIFPRDLLNRLPNFLVGRVGWDNWLLRHAQAQDIKTIDITSVNPAIHQNHDYRHQIGRGNNIENNKEAKHNLILIEPKARNFTLADLRFRLTREGLIKQKKLPGWINKAFTYVVFCLFTLFIFTRSFTAIQGIKQVGLDMLNILIFERNLSYDEKMLRLRGPSYIYLKHLNEVTPKNADICFSGEVGDDLAPFIAASHIFPRTLSVSPLLADGPQNCKGVLLPINEKVPRFVMLYQSFPNFPVLARRIYLFGPTLDSPNQVIENIKYTPRSAQLQGQIGVIEL